MHTYNRAKRTIKPALQGNPRARLYLLRLAIGAVLVLPAPLMASIEALRPYKVYTVEAFVIGKRDVCDSEYRDVYDCP